jgi:hypothetical protein
VTRPPTVRAVMIIAWIRIVVAILVVGVLIAAASGARPPSGSGRGVWEGFLAGAGVTDQARFTARQAGAASFRPLMSLLLSALLLAFLGRRRLLAARITEGVFLLLTLASPSTLLSLVVLGLLFTPSVVAYCRGPTEAVAAGPAPAPAPEGGEGNGGTPGASGSPPP